ncbi:MAG: FMN-binding protein [Planctomycetes bacterium]|nr:FMN-binding protein [Planctomycetota bacterium]
MNKFRQNIYTICFAIILGLACATLLTFAAEFTRPKQNENKQAEEIKNILAALKVPFEVNAGPSDLIAIFERDVIEQSLGEEGDSLTLYVYKPEGTETPVAVAVRFIGPGLWGPIKGFLAIEPDYKTIRGVTFYEQEETPGLGGDIVTDGFRSRFEGKHIADEAGQWGLDIVPGGTEHSGINQIAGISGATMTCDKVEEMINAVIETLAAKREAYGQ